MFTKKIIMIFILSFISISIIFSVSEKEKKVKDEKVEKVKEEKDKKVKDKISDKLKEIFTVNAGNEKSTRNEMLSESNEDNGTLTAFLSDLEDYDKKTQSLKKDLKVDLNNNIKSTFSDIRTFINRLDTETQVYFNKFNSDNKPLINEQEKSVKNSLSGIKNNLNYIEKRFNNNISNEELFNKTSEIEHELKNIYRQFRAIEWILSES